MNAKSCVCNNFFIIFVIYSLVVLDGESDRDCNDPDEEGGDVAESGEEIVTASGDKEPAAKKEGSPDDPDRCRDMGDSTPTVDYLERGNKLPKLNSLKNSLHIFSSEILNPISKG
jgi:hypothetical protein